MPSTYNVTVNVHTSLLTPNSGPICSYVLAQMLESLVTHAVHTANTIVITLSVSQITFCLSGTPSDSKEEGRTTFATSAC
jgi:hypothetical protein